MFKCNECGSFYHTHKRGFTTGYGIDKDDNKICYTCCAKRDKEYMREHGRITLYLSEETDPNTKYPRNVISNWPGSLRIKAGYYRRKGRHNIAGTRYDVWFKFEGYVWWGVQYGNNTQLLHCKRTKERA